MNIEERKNNLIEKLNEINEKSFVVNTVNGEMSLDNCGVARSKIIKTVKEIEDIYIASREYQFLLSMEGMETNYIVFDKFVEEQIRYCDFYYNNKIERFNTFNRFFSEILLNLEKEYSEIEDEIKEVFGDEEIVEIEGPYLEKYEKLPYKTKYIKDTYLLEIQRELNKEKYENERKKCGKRNEKEWDGSINIVLQKLVKKHFKFDIDLTGKIFKTKKDFFIYFCKEKEFKKKLEQLKSTEIDKNERDYIKWDIKNAAEKFSDDFCFVFMSLYPTYSVLTFPNTITKKDLLIKFNNKFLLYCGKYCGKSYDYKFTTIEELEELYEKLSGNKNIHPYLGSYKKMLNDLTVNYNKIDILFKGIPE